MGIPHWRGTHVPDERDLGGETYECTSTPFAGDRGQPGAGCVRRRMGYRADAEFRNTESGDTRAEPAESGDADEYAEYAGSCRAEPECQPKSADEQRTSR